VLALLSAGSTLTAHSQEQAAQLAALATDAIRKILTDPSTPAHVRLKAALAILDKVTVFSAFSASQRSLREPTESMPNPDPQSDKTNPPPETPAQNAQSTKTNPQGPGPNEPCGSGREPEPAPAPEEQIIVHKPAQNAQSTKTNPPRPGRNEPCPCGSGRKFKRCCIDGPQAAAA
jgi:hypothetical protein